MLTFGRIISIVSMVLVALGCPSAPPPPVTNTNPRVGQPVPAFSVRAEIGFWTPRHLSDHFRKHGGEFAGYSEADYLRAAQGLRDTLAGGDILEIARSDGGSARFDRKSGRFISLNADGTIRTLFVPNDGEAYFRRQARRSQR